MCSSMLTLPVLRHTADHSSVVPGKVVTLLYPPPQSLLSRGWKKSIDFFDTQTVLLGNLSGRIFSG